MTKKENLDMVEIALMMILKMDDHNTWEQQMECLGNLRKLQKELKEHTAKGELIMKKKLRTEVVRAMETLAHCVNDESIFEEWLAWGVADGDIDDDTEDEELEYYIEDDNFKELMGVFLHMMYKAYKDGGLYVDGVVSK